MLLLQSVWVWFPESIWLFTTVCISTSRGSDVLSVSEGNRHTCYTHIYKQTLMHIKFKNLEFYKIYYLMS